MSEIQVAIIDAAARYYGAHIAQGGLPALLQVVSQLGALVQAAQPHSPPPEPVPPQADQAPE